MGSKNENDTTNKIVLAFSTVEIFDPKTEKWENMLHYRGYGFVLLPPYMKRS